MSLARYLTDRVSLRRARTGTGTRLPTGERDQTGGQEDLVADAIPCRIRAASPSVLALGTAMGSTEVIGTEAYVALFAPDQEPLPQVNDRLYREADNQVFQVTGWPDLHGELGHAMVHYAAPVKRAG